MLPANKPVHESRFGRCWPQTSRDKHLKGDTDQGSLIDYIGTDMAALVGLVVGMADERFRASRHGRLGDALSHLRVV